VITPASVTAFLETACAPLDEKVKDGWLTLP
jgi:hypothetical protein